MDTLNTLNEQDLLQLVFDTSDAAIFLIDTQGIILHTNQRMADMFAIALTALHGRDYLELVHDSDRLQARQKMREMIAGTLDSVKVERRYLRQDGTEFWGQLSARPLSHPSGNNFGMVGTIIDIDQRKHAEQRLEESHHRFERMARTLPCTLYDFVLHPDGSNTFLYLSPRVENIFEVAAETILNDTARFWELVHPDDVARLRDETRLAARSGGLFVAEVRIITPSGKIRWIRLSSQACTSEGTEPPVWSGFIFDITEQKELQDAMHQLVITDFLTGIPNRRYFTEHAQVELERVRRSGRPASVMMLDLDHFKIINDTHGHASGDRVLMHFTRTVATQLRRIDLFARTGGEEFAILLPETELAGTRILAERLCRIIGSEPASCGDSTIPYTVSIGYATFTAADEPDLDALLFKADRALYQAKQQGRNQASPFIP